ncbi:PKD domain-containing protein [bacterium]|nr:PKD domain-containing protein [bacterium]
MKKITYLLILSTISWFSALTNGATLNVSTTPELREALTTAATNGEDDTIILADGIYKTTDDGLGTFKYLSNESNSIKLQGSDNSLAVLSGEGLHPVIRHYLTSSISSQILISNVSIVNGNNKDGGENGGGVFSNSHVVIENCRFENNLVQTYNTRTSGGAISAESVDVDNSVFQSNTADYSGGAISVSEGLSISSSNFIQNSVSPDGYGGAIMARSPFSKSIDGSTFTENTAGYGGALSMDNAIVEDSRFSDNVASGYGGAIHSFYGISISNSVLERNEGNTGASIYNGSGAKILNTLFLQNFSNNTYNTTSNVYLTQFNGDDILLNNIFLQNNTDYELRSNVLMILDYNYIDVSRVMTDFIGSNNFNDNVNLGFQDIVNGNYHLTEDSDLIDAGSIGFEGIDFPETDMDGNRRISGGAIDIGPYEFVSNRPTISDFGYSGEAKVGSPLTFFAKTLEDISALTLTVDVGDGFVSFVEGMQFNFSTAGDYPVTLRVMNEQGAISSRTIIISVRDLTFSEKIENATVAGRQEVISNPSTYGLALVSEIPVAREAGRQDVISSPSAYDLALASEIPVAREEQVAACLASPSSCGINIPNADVDGNGTQDALTDGLLMLRYSFGLTGDSLISGVVAEDATRKTAEEIEAYLATLMPSL